METKCSRHARTKPATRITKSQRRFVERHLSLYGTGLVAVMANDILCDIVIFEPCHAACGDTFTNWILDRDLGQFIPRTFKRVHATESARIRDFFKFTVSLMRGAAIELINKLPRGWGLRNRLETLVSKDFGVGIPPYDVLKPLTLRTRGALTSEEATRLHLCLQNFLDLSLYIRSPIQIFDMEKPRLHSGF